MKETRQNEIMKRFGQLAAGNAGSPALKTGSYSLSYAELQSRAQGIAGAIAGCYDDRFGLSRKEKIRYKRNILLWGIEGQERLKAAKVFVAGAGGSGSPLIMQLALCGIGTIVICDFDNVELSNLNRQCLHDESRLGMNKALSAKMTVERINPHVQVIVQTERLTAANAHALIGGCTIIFDNVDDLETKFVLSECSVHMGIPYVLSSMMELNSYAVILHPPLTPCLDCLYDRGKIEDYKALRALNKDYKIKPIAVASPSLFLSAGFACNEALKLILGLENPAYNKYFLFNQRGTKNIVHTDGFKAITYPFKNHFKEICREQGFDWDECWRGNFLEELTIRPDPRCPVCSDKNRVKQLQAAAGQKPAGAVKKTVNARCAALLYREYSSLLPAALGALAANAALIPLDPAFSEELLSAILDESETRILLTDTSSYQQALEIRDMTNKNIVVIDTGAQAESAAGTEAIAEAPGNNNAYVIYAPAADGALKAVPYPVAAVLESIAGACAGKFADYNYQPGKVEVFNFHSAMTYLLGALLNGDALAENGDIIVNEALAAQWEKQQDPGMDFDDEFGL